MKNIRMSYVCTRCAMCRRLLQHASNPWSYIIFITIFSFFFVLSGPTKLNREKQYFSIFGLLFFPLFSQWEIKYHLWRHSDILRSKMIFIYYCYTFEWILNQYWYEYTKQRWFSLHSFSLIQIRLISILKNTKLYGLSDWPSNRFE